MTEFFVLIGLPASGKTTWAEKWVANEPKGRARVNKDSLRLMLHAGVYLGAATELQVDAVRDAAIGTLLGRGVSVVSDDTNLDREKRYALVDMATRAGARQVTFVSFTDVAFDECVRRDALRERPVGVPAILALAERYGLDSKSLRAAS